MNTNQDHVAQAKRLLVAFSGGYPVTDARAVDMGLTEYAEKIRLAPPVERFGLVQTFIDEESKLPPVSAVRLAAKAMAADQPTLQCPECVSGFVLGKIRGIECVKECPACRAVTV